MNWLGSVRKKNALRLLKRGAPRFLELTCPEGLKLQARVANMSERWTAFITDWIIIILFAFVVNIFVDFDNRASIAFYSLLWYCCLNFYFLFFELAWRGRTPGKRIAGLQVINRRGGELTPTMVIARNLTRQVEIFFPLRYLLLSFASDESFLKVLDFFFIVAMVILPYVTKNHYRLGDLIGGSVVVAMPKAVLLEDLADKSQKAAFVFTQKQLGVYGDLELQTLEKALRLAKGVTSPSLRKICLTIVRKIKYGHKVNFEDTLRFLWDFYAAERGLLERERLFGRHKDSQSAPTRAIGEAPKANASAKKEKSGWSQWQAKRIKKPPEGK
ncbi:MAG: RDD family protein [Deltaproteobacteria bacterium]|jgi:uncharacterized RDD family membrane protein YckC|nr:RDD family protein [Deltaproteobacteria bacterium]